MGAAVKEPVKQDEDRILIVDDDEGVRRVLKRLLDRHEFPCDTAADVAEAKEKLVQQEFALVLSDMTMPGESGLELVSHVAETYPDTATIMVTGVDDTAVAERALEMGAYGYIVKPFEATEILISLSSALRRRSLEIAHRSDRARLELMVKDRTKELWEAIAGLERAEQELRQSREETVYRLSIAAEYRDDETAKHIQRMSQYCAILARHAGYDDQQVELIRVASVMHDVGKIGIADKILRKPGKLTDEERSDMQEHTKIGFNILSGSSSPFMQTAATIALTHHEKVDGTGYPNGLSGEDIPREGRIAAIADVFDALVSERIYKKAFPIGKAVQIMKDDSGSHFDPELLNLFLGAMDEVLKIQEGTDASPVAIGSAV